MSEPLTAAQLALAATWKMPPGTQFTPEITGIEWARTKLGGFIAVPLDEAGLPVCDDHEEPLAWNPEGQLVMADTLLPAWPDAISQAVPGVYEEGESGPPEAAIDEPALLAVVEGAAPPSAIAGNPGNPIDPAAPHVLDHQPVSTLIVKDAPNGAQVYADETHQELRANHLILADDPLAHVPIGTTILRRADGTQLAEIVLGPGVERQERALGLGRSIAAACHHLWHDLESLGYAVEAGLLRLR